MPAKPFERQPPRYEQKASSSRRAAWDPSSRSGDVGDVNFPQRTGPPQVMRQPELLTFGGAWMDNSALPQKAPVISSIGSPASFRGEIVIGIHWEEPFCGEGDNCFRLGTDDDGNAYIAVGRARPSAVVRSARQGSAYPEGQFLLFSAQ